MPRPPSSHNQGWRTAHTAGLSPRAQTCPTGIGRGLFFKISQALQLLGCFSCSLFSLHSHSWGPRLIASAPSPLPLNRWDHQSAKNIEIAKCNFSPEMTNLLQSVFPNRSCSSQAGSPSPSAPSPCLHSVPASFHPCGGGGTPHLHSRGRGATVGRGQTEQGQETEKKIRWQVPQVSLSHICSAKVRQSTQQRILRQDEGPALPRINSNSNSVQCTASWARHFIYKILGGI